ncbi:MULTISPECIES: hypothetical protein [unclassified Actinomadura]|uniref:hypothetical protein n=1 Tax=unclassified Actinomadura TaxID=2626254 RepID=UPI0011EE17D0|nr:hypothetical protein [Actinomadura sp. K4S16]
MDEPQRSIATWTGIVAAIITTLIGFNELTGVNLLEGITKKPAPGSSGTPPEAGGVPNGNSGARPPRPSIPDRPKFRTVSIEFRGSCDKYSGCNVAGTFRNYGGEGGAAVIFYVKSSHLKWLLAQCSVSLPRTGYLETATVWCNANNGHLYNYMTNYTSEIRLQAWVDNP